ncbi:MAG: sulfatase [Acidobacteria bacterium]|nr:sulfatase [Acidobacteriota bacterium]
MGEDDAGGTPAKNARNHGAKVRGAILPWRCWLAPVLLGVPLAVLIGSYQTLPALLQQGYFHFHLYRTGLQCLTQAIDRWVPGLVGFLLLLVLSAWLGALARGHAGKILRQALPLAVIVAGVSVAYLRLPALPLLARDTVHEFLMRAPLLLAAPATRGILLAVLLIVAGAFLWARRRLAGSAATAPSRCRLLHATLAGAVTTIAVLVILLWGGGHLAAWALAARERNALADRPNVIFIMADTLRADHLGCYHYDLPTTPNLDQLARDGLRFASAQAQSSWTLWSVNSLMTSRYPATLFPAQPELPQSPLLGTFRTQLWYPTLAEVLRENGYATYAIVSNPYLRRNAVNTQGYDAYDDSPLAILDTAPTSPAVTRAALARLASLKKRKFFLYLLYMDPHAPYLPHPGFAFGNSAREVGGVPAGTDPARWAKRRQDLRLYDAEIGFTDHHIGRLLDALKREGLYDDALIVFFSDHGEEFLDHGRFGHMRTVYEEVIRVPLIVKLPRQHRGIVVRGTFPLIDLYPSLLAYLGIDASTLGPAGEVADLPNLVRCKEQPLFSETVQGVRSVRVGERKYILDHPAGNPRAVGMEQAEFYDLAADPGERHNLLRESPAAAAPLVALLQTHDSEQRLAWRAFTRQYAGAKQEIPLPTGQDRQLLKRLQTLGYLNGGGVPP